MGKATVVSVDQDQSCPATRCPELLWDKPQGTCDATLILAHGAGAPMDSEFMQQISQLLANCGIAVVRFEFAYMAARRIDGKRRPPNPQSQLLEQWRGVYAEIRRQTDGPVVIGGKSMGGRMASIVADELGAAGLVCLGYPFYASGKPEKPRTAHLAGLQTRTLIVQGERDALGDRQAVVGYDLSPAIGLKWLEAADHDLKPLKRSGFTHSQHLQSAANEIAAFIKAQSQ
ncbi:alpha/beta family hydrolase [Pseudomonas sp. RL_15y_Pfl2_60]|uniref:alpha/beta family hydrolase n=1 Tax=Pseudomonas sp. RL_15y_Pfl2_60 TaxID=3088709 RepID=UPI0030DC1173